jgi:D-beta-D-heptose 7-phosphate kinase/D-beta-D-heptose 1-phosphate adenosyltransferase
MTVVAISGGFDPIHVGHIDNIREATKLGDLLVILNTDEWLTKKKGNYFQDYESRKYILENIKGVWKVVPQIDTDMSVNKSLEHYKPDIFAKGGDRLPDNIPEYETCERLGIEMKFNIGVDPVKGSKYQSSSWLLERWIEINTKDISCIKKNPTLI